MGIFDRVIKAMTTSDLSATVLSTADQDNSELENLKMQLGTVDQELEAAYSQVGKKFIDRLIQTGETGGLDVADILRMMEPKLERKEQLEKQIVEVTKRIKQNDLLRERAVAQSEFEQEKGKLDKALAMEVLSLEEYEMKLAIAKKKFDNFEQIRRVGQQLDMNLITKEEYDAKMRMLTK